MNVNHQLLLLDSLPVIEKLYNQKKTSCKRFFNLWSKVVIIPCKLTPVVCSRCNNKFAFCTSGKIFAKKYNVSLPLHLLKVSLIINQKKN